MPTDDSTNPPPAPSAVASEPIERRFSRRSGPVEQGMGRRRPMLLVVGLTVAATIVCMSIALAGWRVYSEWRLGRVVLTTDGPARVGQVLAEATDEPIGDRFSIGPYAPLALPAGDYRLRVQDRGRMSQTYRVAFNRGETRTHRVTLSDGRMNPSENIHFSRVVAVELTPGKADFIEWTDGTLIRRDGATGKPIWDVSRPKVAWQPGRDPTESLKRLARAGSAKLPHGLVESAPDLNHDGTRDLVWPIHGPPSYLALSGVDGSLLWTDWGSGGPALPRLNEKPARVGQIIGKPIIADVDADGLPDLIAEFLVSEHPYAYVDDAVVEPVADGHRVVVAVSGRSGRELWNHVIDQQTAELPTTTPDDGIYRVSTPKGSLVAFVDQSRWIGLDMKSGRPINPAIDFGFTPVPPIEHVDLDGDGIAEILALEPWRGNEPLTAPTLVAFSATSGKRLWRRSLLCFYRPMPAPAKRSWPLAADLDGDGHCEIVVPDFDRLRSYGGGRSYGGIELLDGASGQPLWSCPLWPGMDYAYDGLIHLLEARDLDADGTRDLIVVSRHSSGLRRGQIAYVRQQAEPSRIYVDAVSARTGAKLWHWRTDLNHGDYTPVGAPFWWGRGGDGWPMLGLAIGTSDRGNVGSPFLVPDPPVVHLLAAATGREVHAIEGLSSPETADLDGDGLADLWGELGGNVCAFRGLAAESWRALGGFQPAGDLDGDGLTDVVNNDLGRPQNETEESTDSRTVITRSGRDGRMLWRTPLDSWEAWSNWNSWTHGYTISPLKLPNGDLDGDGMPDLIAHRSISGLPLSYERAAGLGLRALSGRTGRELWSSGAFPYVAVTPWGDTDINAMTAFLDDRRGGPDLCVWHSLFMPGKGTAPAALERQSRIARLSGRDGRVVWDVLVADYRGGFGRPVHFDQQCADLDGDGALELVLLFQSSAPAGIGPLELRVLSVATGETRWSRPIDSRRRARCFRGRGSPARWSF